MATIKVCDICLHTGDKKMVESRYRWGFKGGFKMDLCKAHSKNGKDGNPFAKLKEAEVHSAFSKMIGEGMAP